MSRTILAAVAVALLSGAGCGRPDQQRIVVRGSVTMLGLSQQLAVAHARAHPGLDLVVSGGGSVGGIQALLQGTADVACSSRRASAAEHTAAATRGLRLDEHEIGRDALAICVHRDNPLPTITLPQLREIYREGGSITRWSQLGVALPHGDAILTVSRQTNSGTQDFFRSAVLGPGGRERLDAVAPSSGKEVVTVIGRTRSAIGFVSVACVDRSVRVLPLAPDAGAAAVLPGPESVRDGSYPLVRPLFVYSLDPPREQVAGYIGWICGDQGQHILQQNGYLPARKT